jgi:hypothetical protein
MSQQMGLWSYSQLTSLHLAFIKLPLSKFVAPESRGCLLPKPNSLTNSSNAPRPFATAQRTNGCRRAFVHRFASKHRNRRAKIPVKAGDVVTTHSNINSDAHATIRHRQNFCAFPAGGTSVVDSHAQAATKKIRANASSELR